MSSAGVPASVGGTPITVTTTVTAVTAVTVTSGLDVCKRGVIIVVQVVALIVRVTRNRKGSGSFIRVFSSLLSSPAAAVPFAARLLLHLRPFFFLRRGFQRLAAALRVVCLPCLVRLAGRFLPRRNTGVSLLLALALPAV